MGTITDKEGAPLHDEDGKPIYEDDEPDMTPVPGTNANLNLTQEQGIRTTALMLAIKYQADTVIKDAGMYQQLRIENKAIGTVDVKDVLKHAQLFEFYIKTGQVSVNGEIIELGTPNTAPVKDLE